MLEEKVATSEIPAEEKKPKIANEVLPDEKKHKLDLLKDKFKNIPIGSPPSILPDIDYWPEEKKQKFGVDDIVERGKKKAQYYGSIAKERVEERAKNKEKSERIKQSTFRMSLGHFSLFNKLRGRALQHDKTLTYETLMKYSLDMLDKMEDSKLIDIVERYSGQD